MAPARRTTPVGALERGLLVSPWNFLRTSNFRLSFGNAQSPDAPLQASGVTKDPVALGDFGRPGRRPMPSDIRAVGPYWAVSDSGRIEQ